MALCVYLCENEKLYKKSNHHYCITSSATTVTATNIQLEFNYKYEFFFTKNCE